MRDCSTAGMPTPWSVTAMKTRPSCTLVRIATGLPGGVGQGVVDEVGHGGDQQVGVAVDAGAAAGASSSTVSSAPGAAGAQPVDGLSDHRADVQQLGRLQRVGHLQPRQVDDLLHEPGQPVGLPLHPAGEPPHRLRVVAGAQQGLGEQGQPPTGVLSS